MPPAPVPSGKGLSARRSCGFSSANATGSSQDLRWSSSRETPFGSAHNHRTAMRELNLATKQDEVGGGRNGQPNQERFATITIITGSHSAADIQNGPSCNPQAFKNDRANEEVRMGGHSHRGRPSPR
jgi:hypothetical protein